MNMTIIYTLLLIFTSGPTQLTFSGLDECDAERIKIIQQTRGKQILLHATCIITHVPKNK